MAEPIRKYPRTTHIEGSRIQAGDEDLDRIPFNYIAGRHLVLEEKIDGANCAVSFSEDGELLLQSRGHYLTGGAREKHYDLLKQWGAVQQTKLYKMLGSRYIMYGEWMYAKHSIYYDLLPHYFMEFDILDRETGRFLDTPSRRDLTDGLPISSVPVQGHFIYHHCRLSAVSEMTKDTIIVISRTSFFTAPPSTEPTGHIGQKRPHKNALYVFLGLVLVADSQISKVSGTIAGKTAVHRSILK